MLNLWIGDKKFDNQIGTPDFFFDEEMNKHCIDTDFGRRVVTECSDIYKIHTYAALELPNGEFISPSELSSGAKNLLIMMFSEKDVVCDMLWCGDNCNKFVTEIANTKDITLKTSRYSNPFNSSVSFNDGVLILNTGVTVRDSREFCDHFMSTDLYYLV